MPFTAMCKDDRGFCFRTHDQGTEIPPTLRACSWRLTASFSPQNLTGAVNSTDFLINPGSPHRAIDESLSSRPARRSVLVLEKYTYAIWYVSSVHYRMEPIA